MTSSFYCKEPDFPWEGTREQWELEEEMLADAMGDFECGCLKGPMFVDWKKQKPVPVKVPQVKVAKPRKGSVGCEQLV